MKHKDGDVEKIIDKWFMWYGDNPNNANCCINIDDAVKKIKEIEGWK